MAESEPLRNNPRVNRMLQWYKMNREREAALLTQYTLFVTRELVFAVDLMGFVMTQRDLSVRQCPYLDCFDRCGIVSDFDDQVKRFVELIMAGSDRENRDVEEYLEQDHVGYEEFKSLVHRTAFKTSADLLMKSRRNSTYHFLSVCIRLAEICALAYQKGMLQAPRFGIMFMCRTYLFFVNKSLLLRDDPWKGIKFVAHKYVSIRSVTFV